MANEQGIDFLELYGMDQKTLIFLGENVMHTGKKFFDRFDNSIWKVDKVLKKKLEISLCERLA